MTYGKSLFCSRDCKHWALVTLPYDPFTIPYAQKSTHKGMQFFAFLVFTKTFHNPDDFLNKNYLGQKPR
jgi:hypothetical protein